MKYLHIGLPLVVIQFILVILQICIPLPDVLSSFTLYSLIIWFIAGIILGIFIAWNYIDERFLYV